MMPRLYSFSILVVLCLAFASSGMADEFELIYAEMEFPLSFVKQLHQYQFNPLGRFQTEVEGRLMELTCDPLVDIYEISAGQQAYRPCLSSYRTESQRSKEVLNFNLIEAQWPDGRPISFEDVWFSLEYRKLSDVSWSGNQNLVITARGSQSFDAYFGDMPEKAPKPGEFYFPLVNRNAFDKPDAPGEARVKKESQHQIGYGRYYISDVQENQFIRMKRKNSHPYFQKLQIPKECSAIDSIRMQAFSKARIARNEQFIEGRVHLLASVNQSDASYILNSRSDTRMFKYFDDSFSSFVFNCRNPYLKAPAVRRALNYIFLKKRALQKALGGEGDIVSGPLPSTNHFYNVSVPSYEDSIEKGMAVLSLYRYWGMDVYERGKQLFIGSDPVNEGEEHLKQDDQILSVEGKSIKSVTELLKALEESKEDVCRIEVARGKRIWIKRIKKSTMPQIGIFSSVSILKNKLEGFPEFTLIANNPEGKDALIKEICGALKEEMEKIGIIIKIDFLDSKDYYPRLQEGNFDIAYRIMKLTGTPNLHRLFYKDPKDEKVTNTNYGAYYNKKINEIAVSTRTTTDITILKNTWATAHELLHQDPPHLFLWSKKNILVHDPRIVMSTPGSEYDVPYGFTQINGLINIFNEVHLWAFKKRSNP